MQGEVEVEQDGKEDMKNLQIHIENAEEHKEQHLEDGTVPLPFEDTTEQHSSHLFDLNCKICTGKQQPEGEKQPILPHVSTSVYVLSSFIKIFLNRFTLLFYF